MNKIDPYQIIFSAASEKPAFVKITFPSPKMEVAGAGPVSGETTEDYIRLKALPKDLQDRVVLYIKESLRR